MYIVDATDQAQHYVLRSNNVSFQITMANNFHADELAVAQVESRLKTDPSISVKDMQNVLEVYMSTTGNRNFQAFLDVIAAGEVSWTARPKVCIFLKQVCEAFR